MYCSCNHGWGQEEEIDAIPKVVDEAGGRDTTPPKPPSSGYDRCDGASNCAPNRAILSDDTFKAVMRLVENIGQLR